MTDNDPFEKNGTHVTREECAERHGVSIEEAAKASKDAKSAVRTATNWVKLSLAIMVVVDVCLISLIVGLSGSASSAATSASNAAGMAAKAAYDATAKAGTNETKIEAILVLRKETNDLLISRIASLESKIDDLNKTLREHK